MCFIFLSLLDSYTIVGSVVLSNDLNRIYESRSNVNQLGESSLLDDAQLLLPVRIAETNNL